MKNDWLHDDIIVCLPRLRAFALLLARDREFADDLVQEAVVRVLTHADQFEPGTNFKAWVTAILRNCYYNEIRRRGRASQLDIELLSGTTATSGGQEEQLDIREFERAYKTLPTAQREALTLIVASGLSYEDASKMAGCAVGTMKSRVARARIQLQQVLDSGTMPAIRNAQERTQEGSRISGK